MKKHTEVAQAPKRVIVLSDSDLLFNVIKANLNLDGLMVDSAASRLPSEEESQPALSLIIIAGASAGSEPVITLFDAALIQHIGQTPILIISYRGFKPNLRAKIFHMSFPFNTTKLRHQVQELLKTDLCTISEERLESGISG